MKYSAIKSNFKSPYMKKISKRLNVLKMSDDERDEYFYYLKEAAYNQDTLSSATEKGRQEGEARGEAKAIEIVAKRMILKNKPVDEIIEFTSLSKKGLLIDKFL